MTQTQADVKMVLGAEREGMLGPNKGYNTAKPIKTRAKNGNTEPGRRLASPEPTPGTPRAIKDSAFKEEDDAETPSPSSLEEPAQLKAMAAPLGPRALDLAKGQALRCTMKGWL